MLKTVVLKLVSIKYSGDSIGNDIRVEISALDRSIRVDKKIKKGQSAACDETVGKFSVGDKIFNPEIKITVIEKDLIFNDVGSVIAKLKVNLKGSMPQISAHRVEVRESRGKKYGKRSGIFNITFETVVSPMFGYIPETKDGWLKVKDKNGQEIPLPAYLKVQVDGKDAGREHITIMEGSSRGQKASVKQRDDGSSFLITDNPHTLAAMAVYSTSKKVFVLKSRGYKCEDYTGSPWEKGLYDIEIPDSPHPGGLHYTDSAPRAKVWFRVGHSGEKYIHTGSHSLGCITLTEQNYWEEVWGILIKSRKGDGMSIGVLEIID